MVIIQIIMLKGNMMINRGIWGSPISRKRIQGGIPDASKSSWKSSSNLVIESFGFQTDFQVDGFLFAYWHHSWVVSLQSMQVKSVRVNLVCSLQTLWKYVCVDPPHQILAKLVELFSLSSLWILGRSRYGLWHKTVVISTLNQSCFWAPKVEPNKPSLGRRLRTMALDVHKTVRYYVVKWRTKQILIK